MASAYSKVTPHGGKLNSDVVHEMKPQEPETRRQMEQLKEIMQQLLQAKATGRDKNDRSQAAPAREPPTTAMAPGRRRKKRWQLALVKVL